MPYKQQQQQQQQTESSFYLINTVTSRKVKCMETMKQDILIEYDRFIKEECLL